ncbi:MAG: hypothetical protein LC122_02555 [Chitinophagales bacterium]|nr:hypothetical protein [Chitinophagales bacterium]
MATKQLEHHTYYRLLEDEKWIKLPNNIEFNIGDLMELSDSPLSGKVIKCIDKKYVIRTDTNIIFTCYLFTYSSDQISFNEKTQKYKELS